MKLSTIRHIYHTTKAFIAWRVKHSWNGVPIQYYMDETYLKWHYKFRPALIGYKDIHAGEDCFIIGNGPSLNKMDLSLLNGYHLFGLNKIHLIFEKHKLDLSYHVTVNTLVIEQMFDELEQDIYKCPSFISYSSSENLNFQNPRIHKLLTTGRWSFYRTIDQPINAGYTVTYVAMQLAFYMGFRNVFLIGVDHNFKQAGKPNEQQLYEKEDENHFHPEYFKNQQWHLADVEGNEASYALAKHQFHTYGREIYDATVDGKLTLFKKISFQEALDMAKKK